MVFLKGLEKNEEEFTTNPSVYLAKSWARHYLNSKTLSEKVDLAHKIKVQARNSNNTELIELASKVGEEYGKIKFRYIELRGNELLRKIIANEFLIATENLIDKLRTL